jgi:hypothetical protein
MISSRRFALLICVLSFTSLLRAQYFPGTGRAALYQESLDTQERLNVLSISLRPGYEDLATLAYLRLGRGAQITSLYITNAEAGESDVHGGFPTQLAAEKRAEAAKAITLLDGAAIFLNMPDISAASDTAIVYSKWRMDTLRTRLKKIISEFHPDLIVIARDWLGGSSSPQMEVFESELLRTLRILESMNPPVMAWGVSRVLVDKGSRSGAEAPVDRVHPIWKKSYRAIGEEAARSYRSISIQQRLWRTEAGETDVSRSTSKYDEIYPRRGEKLKSIDQGLPRTVSPRLRNIENMVGVLTTATKQGRKTVAAAGRPEEAIIRLAALIDSLDRLLAHVVQLSYGERKIALQWKLKLEQLRVVMLGVHVRYTFDPTILTERQLSMFEIDTILGIRPGGKTYLYFPSVGEHEWVVNETPYKIANIEYHKPYRLLTPQTLEFDLPASREGLSRTNIGSPFLIYVIHEGARHYENFMYRILVPVQFAPRFTAEVLTPIVAAVPSERVVLQLINHTRDGVRDSVTVDDSLVYVPKKEFRLSTKESNQTDTLQLTWKRTPDDVTYVIPITVESKTIAQFAARHFAFRVDSSKHVGLISGLHQTPTADALRRLGVSWEYVRPGKQLGDELAKYQVVILDRRALSLDSGIQDNGAALDQFVQSGGHLIVLAQDAAVWNAKPLIEGLILRTSTSYDEGVAMETADSERLLTYPNQIRPSDWTNWLDQKAHNVLSGAALSQARVPVKIASDHNPVLATWKKGKGNFTYVDFALQPQILNVLPGAYRLLANLLSY